MHKSSFDKFTSVPNMYTKQFCIHNGAPSEEEIEPS